MFVSKLIRIVFAERHQVKSLCVFCFFISLKKVCFFPLQERLRMKFVDLCC